MKNWYVLQVATGKEKDVQRQLNKKGICTLLPTENRLLRSGGSWHEKEYVFFPGYVFLLVDYTAYIYHVLKAIPYTIKLLPNGKPTSLYEDEVAWLLEISGSSEVSKVDMSGEVPKVVSGLLLNLQQYIKKYDRHSRKAQLEITVLGEMKKITLSFVPV